MAVNPETRIEYTIDLTRQYHNLLQKEEGGNSQSYLWDGNVAGMREDTGNEARYYLQDELGSPIRLMDQNGELAESYGYDEFGQDLYGNQGTVQPFGYTGYQTDQITGTYYAQMREYRASEGRFEGEDLVKHGSNWYIYVKNNPIRYVDPLGLAEYELGDPQEPEYNFDEDFVYDENKNATVSDGISYLKWGILGVLSAPVLPEASKSYRHYRSGEGTDLEIDLQKAFEEDSYYMSRRNEMIREAQLAAETLHQEAGSDEFSMTGGLFNFYNGTSENWQKTLGAFNAWGSANVVYADGIYTMEYTIHVKDRYNFNRGQSDIASGVSDNVNGVFAELGWVKSFITYGETTITISWTQGNIESGKIEGECDNGR